jgi:hypothetical protein
VGIGSNFSEAASRSGVRESQVNRWFALTAPLATQSAVYSLIAIFAKTGCCCGLRRDAVLSERGRCWRETTSEMGIGKGTAQRCFLHAPASRIRADY